MAMKGKGGAAGGVGVWPVYTDFKPISEWKQDAHSHDLIVFLPGFMKEQLRVSTEGRNIIRVRGERLLTDNKWSRFLEDFEVPENSDMNLVRAKFHEGALTITIPKKTIDKPDEIAPEKKAVGTHQDEKQGHTNDDRSKETSSPKQKHAEIERAEGEKKSTVAKEETKSEGSKKLGEDINHEMIGKRADAGKKTTHEMIGKRADAEKKMTLAKEDRKSEIRQELGEDGNHEMTGKMKLKRDDGATPKAKKSKEGKQKEVIGSSRTEHGAFTKAVKGVAGLNEERQLMVNMGAAVLVIAAFSAYVTYKFVAGDDKK